MEPEAGPERGRLSPALFIYREVVYEKRGAYHYAPLFSSHPRNNSQMTDGPNPNFNY